MKTSELTGAALDWAVAKCEGLKTEMWNTKAITVLFPDAPRFVLFMPSRDWAHGGPIIEREDISIRKYHRPGAEGHGKYYAMVCRESGSMVRWSKETSSQGPTPLIAAMRCYVASKLGNAVELPTELLGD